MKKITIYTGPVCNYCDAAKRLLRRNSLEFNEIDISSGPEVLNEMINKTNGKRTIPQIFFDNEHIGGYVEIRELEKNNKLIEFLK
ncbi:glutaredoxin 3 [Candidatus Pelagibacter communis]|uniref:glutaredoxin 3 n=1 Tax=Pelagibacter ubique TaxID=198252 RepID=UPI00094C0529|nr:glutaredoxin 3 [Candidatus Pelagibacter ubique]